MGAVVQTPAVFWLGDSIVNGTGGGQSTSPPVRLAALSGKYVINGGVPGDTIPQGITRWNAELATGAPFPTLVWSCAVNSFAADMTGAAAWALVQPVLDAAKAAGRKVIITEVMPWKNSATWTVARSAEADAYWVLAQAWASANGASAVATKATMGGQGGDVNVLLTAYNSGDSLHPSVAGQLQFATLVNAASP